MKTLLGKSCFRLLPRLGAAALLAAWLCCPAAAAGLEELRGSALNFGLPRLAAPAPLALPGEPQYVRSGALLPPEVTARLPELGIELNDLDLGRLEESYNFWRQAGPAVWAGVTGVEATPIELVFPNRYNVLIGHPRPPEGCLPFSERLPAERFCYRKDPYFGPGAGTGKLNGVPAVYINTFGVMDALGAQHYNDPDYKSNYLINLATLNHELLHAFQFREKALLPQEAHPSVGKDSYPYGDPELNALLGVEGRILADALRAGGEGEMRELALDYQAVRAERHSRLPAAARMAGRYMELIEGTAKYISYKVLYGAYPALTPLPGTLADPRFPGYGREDRFADALEPALLGLHSFKMAYMATYGYYSGAAVSGLLDKLSPGWKDGLFRSCSGFSCGLDTLLERTARPDNTPARVARALARYDEPRLRAESELELASLLAGNRKKIEDFKAAPGRRARLAFPGTPAADMQYVASGNGVAEYGGERLYTEGCNKVVYSAGEEHAVDFTVKNTALLNMRTAVLEVALPDSAPASPEIKADRVSQAGGETVYEGNVSFDNGVFKWSGGKLGVSEENGVTLLSFYPAE